VHSIMLFVRLYRLHCVHYEDRLLWSQSFAPFYPASRLELEFNDVTTNG
jgi:hypothetical protein